MSQTESNPAAPHMYTRDDPDMPEEYRAFMIKLLKYAHIENAENPYSREVVANIADAGLRHAPTGKDALVEAVIVKQEAEHGMIVAKLIESFGESAKIDKPIGQYAFKMKLATWCDVAWFHGLIDRVGLYVGIEWMGATYEPLAKVSPRLEREEQFHADTGFRHLRAIVKTDSGRSEAQDLLHKWWPAALDMFGRSDSKNSESYVKWGIKTQSNEELRQTFIAEVVPMIEGLDLEVPDLLANRKYV
ncbi:MAG: Phenylacetic acid catabolic protein [Alphaproteobacteria bacterium]